MAVIKYENFFEEDLYEEIFEYAKQIYNSENQQLYTHRVWPEYIVKDSFPVLCHRYDKREDLLFKKMKEKIESIPYCVEKNLELRNNVILFYYWTQFSYIPWHNDGASAIEAAFTCYLNRNWHKDFGGYYLYEHGDDDIRAILPKRNMALLQNEFTSHSTSAVNYDGKVRYSIQAFLTYKGTQPIEAIVIPAKKD